MRIYIAMHEWEEISSSRNYEILGVFKSAEEANECLIHVTHNRGFLSKDKYFIKDYVI